MDEPSSSPPPLSFVLPLLPLGGFSFGVLLFGGEVMDEFWDFGTLVFYFVRSPSPQFCDPASIKSCDRF